MRIQKNTLFLIVAAAVFVDSSAHIDNWRLRENILKTTRLPGLDVCGISNGTDARVINGRPALLGEFPWMAAIGHTHRVNGTILRRWFCGGSLITDQYVITAAHCLIYFPGNLYVNTVRFGDLNLQPNVNDGASPENFEIEKLTYHEDFDNNRKVNDIALIKLREKINFSENRIIPICLPPPEFLKRTFEGFNPIIAGWGKTNVINDIGAHQHLMVAEVEIKNTEKCRRNITSLDGFENFVIDNRVICASSPGTDACTGDSGGPLMHFKNYVGNGNLFLMGIISYGHRCAKDNHPGVYVRVAEYMSWIIDNLEI